MPGRLHTPLCDMLGIEYPIILAGMGSGRHGQATAPTPVKLVAAITNLGGLGVMGDNFLSIDELDQGIREVKRLVGDKPFGVDFMLPASMAEVAPGKPASEIFKDIERDYPEHVAFVKSLIQENDLSEVEDTDDAYSAYQSMAIANIMRKIEVVLDNKVPVFAAALGDPAIMSERAHAQGTLLIGMAGAVRHAQRHLAAGVDIVVAQGTEAGGHTGNIATFVLVPQIVDAVAPRPVVAAGGVGSGRQLAAALALGAQGVWVGTAFLVAEEGNTPEIQKDQILGGRSEQFTLSKYGSGKQQRGYHTTIKEAWEKSGLKPLPMPLQGILQRPLNAAIYAAGRWDLIAMPSGQVGGMVTERRPAREIFTDIVNGAEETIEHLQHNLH